MLQRCVSSARCGSDQHAHACSHNHAEWILLRLSKMGCEIFVDPGLRCVGGYWRDIEAIELSIQGRVKFPPVRLLLKLIAVFVVKALCRIS